MNLSGDPKSAASTCQPARGASQKRREHLPTKRWSKAQNQSEEAILRASPDLMPAAVEEFLRIESPVQRLRRVALEDIEIEGAAIKKGDLVFSVVASANRDPEQLPDPDRLGVRRSDARHLALGLGIHLLRRRVAGAPRRADRAPGIARPVSAD